MKNKKLLIPILVLGMILSFAVAACSATLQPTQTGQSAGQPAQQNTTPSSPQAAQPAGPGNNGNMSTESKLAIGTLKLEGTDLAVSADEAKTLLPLWQQVKTLSADSQTTTDQLQKVYTQIKSAMTADQVKKIENASFTFDDIQAMLTKLGIQVTPGAGGGRDGGSPNGGGPNPGTPLANQNGSAPQGTPGPQGMGGPGGGGPGNRGMNTMFLDALIKLLQQRAGA